MKEKTILIGILIDLSYSMNESIRNSEGGSVERYISIKNSLKKLAKEVNKKLYTRRGEEKANNILFFIYAFGTRSYKFVDFLTFIHPLTSKAEKVINIMKVIQEGEPTYEDPFNELQSIAQKYGKLNWGLRAKHIFKKEEADKIASLMNYFPEITEKIIDFLPDEFVIIEDLIDKSNVDGGLNAPLITPNSKNRLDDPIPQFIESVLKKILNTKTLIELSEVIEKNFGKIISNHIQSKSLFSYTTFSFEKIVDLLEHLDDEKLDEEIKGYFGGPTAMIKTFKEVFSRIRYEELLNNNIAEKIIFVISDGNPKDGTYNDVILLAEKLKEENVKILSCFITNEDIVTPKVLYTNENPDWSIEAKMMFTISSPIYKDLDFEGFLRSKGWTVDENSKFFIQANHTELVDDFAQLLVSKVEKLFKHD